MADVTLIKTKNRGYVRSISDKGREKLMNGFLIVVDQITIDGINFAFNVDVFKDMEEHLKALGLEIEYIP